MEERFLTYTAAAEWFRGHGVPLAEPTLRRMVSERRGPAFVKLSKRVVFAERDLSEFLDSRRVEPIVRRTR
jgi:hypothetical protein